MRTDAEFEAAVKKRAAVRLSQRKRSAMNTAVSVCVCAALCLCVLFLPLKADAGTAPPSYSTSTSDDYHNASPAAEAANGITSCTVFIVFLLVGATAVWCVVFDIATKRRVK